MKYRTHVAIATGDVGIFDEDDGLVGEFFSAVRDHAERNDAAAQARADAFCAIPSPPEDVWAEEPSFPVANWATEVSFGDTRRGYWDWVEAQREQANG